MRCLRESRVPFLLSLTIVLTASHSLTGGQYFIEPGHPFENESDLSVVHPSKVDVDGQFISHSVSQHFEACRRKRDQRNVEYVYYKVDYKGRELTFNLSVNNHLIPNDFILEKRNGSHNITEHRSSIGNSCHLFGTVTDSSARGIAALSTCKGLRGLFTLPEGHFFIEPAKGSPGDVPGNPQPHLVYPRVANKTHRQRRSSEPGYGPSNCGVRDSPEDLLRAEAEREEWEREQQKEGAPPRSKRSVSRERWVETMVVADSKLIEYHGSDNVESYVFTIMNMVAGIFHDASIGNAIHIVLVRLILLQGDEKDLKIVYHADSTLASFCAWQKNLNPQSDTHPAHHDVAVLVTRTDLCAGMNQPCETLGLSHLSGLCQPHRCCNINEDTGLPVAFTIAHEMGHSFGIHHDGQGNDCELKDRHPFIMSRQLIYDSSPLTWSTCSKEYITRFLDRGWGNCLDDRPSKRDFTTPLARLGVRYTTHHQCQLQYGQNATFCPEIDNVCQILWCSVNNSCRSKLDSPVDGTRCGPEKWCISGECVIVGKLPETVSGGWGQWGTWSHCSRTCGAGVQSAVRECNNPKPVFGGKYCTGERKRYRTCNTKPCQKNTPTFREMLCSEFDTVPYQNELYKWIPISSPSTPCELHCRPVNEHFSERMLDAVTDGTPCFMNNNSRNICVNGVCKEVGCDYGINSNALEDRCGICLGDGSACETIQQTFEGGTDFGYVDVGVIPEGARDILVQEMGEAGNFLALRGQGSEDYYLNGNYIIQWNGEYEAGGTTFYYERSGNLENLTAPGPTKRSVMIQLLYQESNPGIKYEYTVKKSTMNGIEVVVPEYKWKHGAWTDCSTTCGAGEQQQPVRCFEFDMGVVEESLCDPERRLEDRHRKCKNMDCPARWWVGGWQQCTATCGSEGMRKRTVLCVRTVAGEERVLHPVECKHLLKPKPVVPCNRDVPCGQEWAVGPWSECPVTCGGSVCSRTVTCRTAPLKSCDPLTKPRAKSLCGLQSCPNTGVRISPGLAPKYRRVYPPKSQPSSRPVSHTHGPGSTSTAATPTTQTTSRQRTTTTIHTSTTSITTPYIIDADDYELAENGGDSQSTKQSPTDKDENYETNGEVEEEHEEEEQEEEEEEGSASDVVVASTPSYAYEVEDRTTQDEGIIDLDSFTTTLPLRTTSLSYPSTQPHTTPVYPTVRKTPYSARTKTRVISTATPFTRRTSPVHWAKTTRRSPLSNPNTTPSMNPYTQRTPRVPHTTPRPSGTSRAPFPTAPVSYPTTHRKIPTPTALKPTVKILKAKKSVVAKSSAPHSKSMGPQSKGSSKSSRSEDQTPGSPVVSSTSTYDNVKAREPINKHVRWLTGNWSECSTTCGMGAVWRIVTCSTSREEDCASLPRPEPARICHLRPCATWKSSNWTKCPDGCELVGRRQRDVQCVDTSSKRPLRPFHCQALSSPPLSSLSCPSKSCLVWRTSPWGPCSGSCGEGMRERMVFCPEFKRCSTTRRPDTSESCSLPPCTHWETQDWEECSLSCGGGVQHRVVTCVSEDSVTVQDDHLCEKSTMPLTHQKCNIQECTRNTGSVCKKNSMSPRFCQKLRLLGRCSLRSVQKQCCATCQE